jgi:endonuclease YncB( thermonuclease family)
MESSTKTILITGVVLIALVFLIGLALILIKIQSSQENSLDNYFLVVNVSDGDTFEIATGETVRLICVDTPEKGEENYTKAKNYLSKLILDKEVRLEADEEGQLIDTYGDEDKYGRLLRYVYVGVNDSSTSQEMFVNKEVVSSGYGELFPYGNSTSKCDEIGGKDEEQI